jgi:hypothetical protein
VTFLTIYPYNYFIQNQNDDLKKEVTAKRILADSFSKSYKQKVENQNWYTNRYKSKFDISENVFLNATMWDVLYKMAKGEKQIDKVYSTLNQDIVTLNKELGFESPQSFQSFILRNIIYVNDLEANKIASKINIEAVKLEYQIFDNSLKIVSAEYQFKTSGLAFIIALIALFILRYIYYCIKWSIMVLKQS